MSRSPLAHSVVAAVAPLLVALAANACSSPASTTSDADPANPAETVTTDTTAADIAANPDSTLDGEYTTSDVGPIEDISFSDGSNYVMWPSPCPAAGSCLSIGTYAVSSDGAQITLTNGATGNATTLAYQAITATPDSVVPTTDELHTEALVVADAGALAKDGGALVKSTVKTATVGTQTVKLVTPVAKLISSSNSNCEMSLPLSGDPSSFLAAAKKALAAKGGTISGSTTAGSFSVPAPLGTVTGSYSVANSAATLKISPDSLGLLQSCSAVYSALKSALGT
jgi:hypothetical protein